MLAIQNYYKTLLLNLDRKLMRMMKLRMKFISLCDLEKIEKMACVEWNGTLTEGEIDKLLCLQMGSFSIATQFF